MSGDEAFRYALADALTLGLGDEAAGGIEAAIAASRGEDAGDAYTQRRDDARGRLDRAREERPGWSFAGGVTGSVLPGTAAFRGLRALNAGARTALYGSSAAAGATYGAGSGENLRERLLGGASGAALGVAGAGAGEAIGGLISVATRGGASPADRAARLAARGLRNSRTSQGVLERRLQAQGMTPAAARKEAARRIEAGEAPTMEPDDLVRWSNALPAQGGEVTEFAAEGVPSWQNTARAVANVDGPGQGIARTRLDARREGLRGRMLTQAEETFAPGQTRSPREYYDFVNSLKSSRDTERQAMFGEAYRTPVDARAFQDTARSLMHGGRVQTEALKKATRIAEFDLAGYEGRLARVAAERGDDAAQDELLWSIGDVRRAIGTLRQLDDGDLPETVNARALEYYQQALWDIVEQAGGKHTPMGGAASQAWSGFTAASDMIAPRLANARQAYGRSMRIEEMAQKGRRIFDLPDGEIDALLRGANNGAGVSLEEGDAFVVGAMEAIDQKLGQGDTAFVARLLRNENWKRQLERSVLRPGMSRAEQQAAKRKLRTFMNRLNREVAGQSFNNQVQSGSRTTPLAQDIKALTDGEAELGFVSDLVPGAKPGGFDGGVLDLASNPRQTALRWAARFYDRRRRPGIYHPAVNQELAQMMYQPATKANMAALAERVRGANNTGAIGDRRMSTMMGLLGAGATRQRAEANPP